MKFRFPAFGAYINVETFLYDIFNFIYVYFIYLPDSRVDGTSDSSVLGIAYTMYLFCEALRNSGKFMLTCIVSSAFAKAVADRYLLQFQM
jgi:hypothetical protein